MTGRLPQLLDARGIMDELGVKRNVADAIIRALPVVTVPGVRKNFVRRDAVLELLEANTNDACTKRPQVAA